jgi:hypothetical protein
VRGQLLHLARAKLVHGQSTWGQFLNLIFEPKGKKLMPRACGVNVGSMFPLKNWGRYSISAEKFSDTFLIWSILDKILTETDTMLTWKIWYYFYRHFIFSPINLFYPNCLFSNFDSILYEQIASALPTPPRYSDRHISYKCTSACVIELAVCSLTVDLSTLNKGC